MREEKLSVRQLSVAALTGALAPAVAGAGYGWQGALLAVPVLLLAGGAMVCLAPPLEGVGDKLCGERACRPVRRMGSCSPGPGAGAVRWAYPPHRRR